MARTAIVIGASMGGLVAAGTLRGLFDTVVLLERDRLTGLTGPRAGVPQGAHVHNLLARGDATLSRIFPALFDRLQANDAQRVDWSRDVRWHHHGVWKLRIDSGVTSWLMSRPLLEDCVRRELVADDRIVLRDETVVEGYAFTDDGEAVTGVILAGGEQVAGDLVVDCTGRRAPLVKGLPARGYEAPPIRKIVSDVVYATRIVRPREAPGFKVIAQVPPPPERRSCVAFAIEDGRWMATLFGYDGAHPPRDDAGWRAFAADLPEPDFAQFLEGCEIETPVRKYHFRESLWRRFDKLSRLPRRLVHLGDAVCSFNPIYGQGMTSATLQAEALERLLASSPDALERVHAESPRKIAAVVQECWQAVASEDFRHEQTTGDKMPGAALVNWYTRRVHRRAGVDPQTEVAFLKVMHMENGFGSLFHPRILLPTLLRAV